MNDIKIGSRIIGQGKPCFVIAEAGVNHNGSLDIAKKLVDAAAGAGVDSVKFQLFDPKEIATEEATTADYMQEKKESQVEFLERLALKPQDFVELKRHCDKKGVVFLCTPHSGIKDADFLDSLGMPAFKIGSGDITNIPLLEGIAKKGKPVLLSTGMSNMQEVKQAVAAVKAAGNSEILVFHCTSAYPTPLKDVNLRAMKTLEKELGTLVGYSDHTQSTDVPAIAVSLGAVMIEKHFTLDKGMPGPDHKSSFNPAELREMMEKIRSAELALGSGEKKPVESELKMMRHIRKSVVAAGDIAKGALVSGEMLAFKRPGTGISPAESKKLLGKKAKRAVKKNELLKWSDFE